MDNEKFSKAFFTLQKSKGRSIDADMGATWYDLLSPYPEEKVLKAMHTLAMSDCDFPTVGKIVALLNPEITTDMVMAGWNAVLDSVTTGRAGKSVVTPEMDQATEQIGGGKVLGYTEYGYAMEALGKRWRAAYKIILDAKHSGQIETAQLPGGDVPQIADGNVRLKLMVGGIGRKI